MVLGLGMAICVAPLTTVVMNSIPLEQSGTASGINNAVSRIAGLLAVAILGLVMIMIFNQQLTKKLTASSLPTTTQLEIISERSQLAAIRTDNEMGQRIIQESFLTGYNSVILIAVILALASSLSAALFLKDPNKPLAVDKLNDN
jgi:MFS family permease